MKVTNLAPTLCGAAVLLGTLLPCQAQTTPQPKYWQWAKTPPMGWNSWDAFGTTVTEAQTKAQADLMASKLKRYGWQYIVVDIQWYEPNANGFDYRAGVPLAMDDWSRLQPSPNKFPSAANGQGFKALAAYVHSKGLKFGIHMMRGISRQAVARNTPIKGTTYRAADIADKNSICPWNPDMYGVDMSRPGAQAYYDSIFEQAASWGLDFVKVDDLSRPYHQSEIEAIRSAIDKSGRPIVFSTSPGETPLASGAHVAQHANMWRISDDFWDKWSALFEQFRRLDAWTPYRDTGHFPDADMLPLGAIRQVGGGAGGWTQFTKDEQVTMMTLWAMARSPLMMGGDLTKNDDWTLSLLTNAEVLGVDQRSSNNRQLFNRDGKIGWIADVPNSKDKYLGLFNTSDAGVTIDGKLAAFKSDLINKDTPGHGVDVSVDITGATKLYLAVDDGGDNFNADHANWTLPRLVGPKGELKLTDLKWTKATAGWGQVSTTQAAGGKAMSVNGQPVAYGIGTHANSLIEFDLPAGYTTFKSFAALDDGGVSQNNLNGSTVHFQVFTQSPYAETDNKVAVSAEELGFQGDIKVRDLWQKKDLGRFKGSFEAAIASHGAGLYRVSGVSTFPVRP